MKFIPLHTKNTTIVYKNALCSTAAVFVLVFLILSVMIPILLVSLLSPYSGISESCVLYEQPAIKYKYQYIFVAEILTQQEEFSASQTKVIVCSSRGALLQHNAHQCANVQYWQEDANNDGLLDFANFKLQLGLQGQLLTFDLILFFEAALQHKCHLTPPAMLTQRFTAANPLQHGEILLQAELQLKQQREFYCAFPGRNFQTKFLHFNMNDTDVQHYELQYLLQQLKRNAAYFQLDLQETFVKTAPATQPLSIELQLQLPQVPARYHLSAWERLAQFWLYFASFFGISCYVINKLKDFLFARHILRAWEVIPWKKLY